MLRLYSRFSLLCITLLLLAGPVGFAQQTSVEGVEGPLTQAAPKTLTNDSIVRMVKAGLGDDLILQTIAAQPGRYTTDADALVALKGAGVSDRIISGMVNKVRRQLTPVKETVAVEPQVNEIGVYYKDRNGNWVSMEPEIVHIKSGGWIKSTVTNGIIKQDRNGRINGRESKLALQAPIEFLIFTPEGVGATEYDLLKFRVHSDNREFRTLTGGVFHSSGGADRDEVPFAPVKTAPRTYQFTVDHKVGGGEFGILPPGTGNVTNGGKIYTFAITE
ncbi:hypothetical protein BH10ACI4_BH10ACI4_23650 [soil metagenome]